jgi:NTE family protein
VARTKTQPEPRNVFVLSGGSSRGAAQVGMMRELLEAGIVPDAFVGTSVGSLNCVYMSQNPCVDRLSQLEQNWLQLSGKEVFGGSKLTMVRNILSRHPYLYHPEGLARLISEWAPVELLEELPTPVRAVTTHMGTGRPAYHDRGNLHDILMASTSMPGIFPPVALPEPDTARPSLHVDGGVGDLVPIAGAIGLSPTRVFVLDVTVPPLLERPRNPLDIVVASLGVSMRLRPVADFGHGVQITHVHAQTVNVSTTDFSKTRELIAAGRKAAQEALAADALKVPEGRVKVRYGRIRLPRRDRG